MEEDWEEEEEEVEGHEARGLAAVMPPTMTTAQRTAALQLCDFLQSAPPSVNAAKFRGQTPERQRCPLHTTPPEASEGPPTLCNLEKVGRHHADDCGPLRERGGSQLAASSSLGVERQNCLGRIANRPDG